MPASPFTRVTAAVARRVAVLLFTVAAAGLVSSALVRLAPGFAMDERQMDLRRSEDSLKAMRPRAGSEGVVSGFRDYLAGLGRGDWGTSISLGRPVRELVVERAGITLRTLAFGLALAWGLALVVSLVLEGWHRRFPDRAATVIAGGLLCLPAAVVALLFLYTGGGPGWALAAILSPRIFRYVRNIVAAAGRRPHVLAARGRGTGGCGLLWRHVCVPAAPELLALAGVSLSMAIGAAIPVEALCDSPGVGQLVWQSAMARDLPMLVHLTVLVAAATCIANLLSDTAGAFAARGA
jgi:peptide/nickel transport system permease protein